MRQTRWAVPGGNGGDVEYDGGALRVVTAGGRPLLAGMFCTTDGFRRVELRDPVTGEVVAVDGGGGQWWRHPADHFGAFTWRGGTYLLHIADKPNGHRVLRVTSTSLEPVEYAFRGGDHVALTAATVLDGRPVIMTSDFDEVRFRALGDGDHVLRSWTPPDGWSCAKLLHAAGRPYAWLDHDVPADTPAGERWRVAAEHGRRLWDLTAGRPAGPPLLVPGFEWGPWELAGRPLMLFKVGWRDLQVWDLGRREPLGPGLGDREIRDPSVGAMHGRPVLAAVTGGALTVWDLGTGRHAGVTGLPEDSIATAVGPAGTAWAMGRAGHLARLTVRAADLHPSAVREGLSPRPRRRSRR